MDTPDFPDFPDFLVFTPVPSKRRRADGWTPDGQRRFVAELGRGASVSEAARAVHLSRQTAHALRSRSGGEGFAAAWDAAQAFARTPPRLMNAPGTSFGCVDTLLVPRTYRGRLIGFALRPTISTPIASCFASTGCARRVGRGAATRAKLTELTPSG